MVDIDLQELVNNLRELLTQTTPGLWEVQDGCSWRRIGTQGHDGNVLCPTNCSHDNHPDLEASDGKRDANLRSIVALHNAAPFLLDYISAPQPAPIPDDYAEAEAHAISHNWEPETLVACRDALAGHFMEKRLADARQEVSELTINEPTYIHPASHDLSDSIGLHRPLL